MRNITVKITILSLSLACIGSVSAIAAEPDQLTAADLATSNPKSIVVTPHAHLNGQAHARQGIFNIDSLQNFNSHYFASGYDGSGNLVHEWYTNTVGNPPQMHGTTIINAPIVPVTVRLLDSDGSQRYVNGHPLISSPTQFVQPVLNSPVFQNYTYSSSDVPTQFTDAVQRAEYWNQAKSDWHTLLAPSLKSPRVMSVPRGSYFFALNSDGTCCRFILVEANFFVNALFPPTATDTTTVIGAAENAGDITTKDMSTFLFPNTFLYDKIIGNCCVLGFHSYDYEPPSDANGNVEQRYVVNYSSWITPGLFGAGFLDVTALSHEIAETYNDPFVASNNVNNVTPWWLAPNGNCQNNLETGDVIEGLPNAVYPITMFNYTYHPQNEALLQWFELEANSDALGGAYSYPNTTVLTAPPTPQKPFCQ